MARRDRLVAHRLDLPPQQSIPVSAYQSPETEAWRDTNELQKQQPYYTKVQLPANTYKGQSTAVDTLAVMAVWAVHDGVPDNVAYEVTKALFENVVEVRGPHDVQKL